MSENTCVSWLKSLVTGTCTEMSPSPMPKKSAAEILAELMEARSPASAAAGSPVPLGGGPSPSLTSQATGDGNGDSAQDQAHPQADDVNRNLFDADQDTGLDAVADALADVSVVAGAVPSADLSEKEKPEPAAEAAAADRADAHAGASSGTVPMQAPGDTRTDDLMKIVAEMKARMDRKDAEIDALRAAASAPAAPAAPQAPAPAPAPATAAPKTTANPFASASATATAIGPGSVIGGGSIGNATNDPPKDPLNVQMMAKYAASPVPKLARVGSTRSGSSGDQTKYMSIGQTGVVSVNRMGSINFIDFTEPSPVVCIGPPRPVYSGATPRVYVDVCVSIADGAVLMSQMRCEGVVIEGVTARSRGRSNAASKRQVGKDFVRMGLPRGAFDPIFEAMEEMMPGCTAELKTSETYFWLNASWGVGGSPASITYMTQKAGRPMPTTTQSIADVLGRLKGKSPIGTAMICLSMSATERIDTVTGARVSADPKMSAKMYGFVMTGHGDYHGPALASSYGISMDDATYKMMSSAPVVPSGMSLAQMSPVVSVFGSQAPMSAFGPSAATPSGGSDAGVSGSGNLFG